MELSFTSLLFETLFEMGKYALGLSEFAFYIAGIFFFVKKYNE